MKEGLPLPEDTSDDWLRPHQDGEVLVVQFDMPGGYRQVIRIWLGQHAHAEAVAETAAATGGRWSGGTLSYRLIKVCYSPDQKVDEMDARPLRPSDDAPTWEAIEQELDDLNQSAEQATQMLLGPDTDIVDILDDWLASKQSGL